MKVKHLFPLILCSFLLHHSFIRAQEIDKELGTLSQKLSALIKENNNKKVTVLDFTDLDGGSSELGKYIAEELTVNLVISKSGFSVLDRAHLKRILAEHKLTATGLIDPENAKKLGMFAGVDAMIFGTIIPKGSNISLNAKIITTETAEIVGAARVEFKSDENVQKLAAIVAKPEPVTGATLSDPPKKLFGELQAKVESIRVDPADRLYGYATLTLTISNMSPSVTYGVGIHPDLYNHFNLMNDRGDEFKATEVNGIQKAWQRNGLFHGDLTDIPPNASITIVSKSLVRWKGKPGEYRPFHLQTEFVFGEEKQGRHPDLRMFNFVTKID